MTTHGALFDLTGRVAIITGGAGLLGEKHADAIASAGGIPVIVDVADERARAIAARVAREHGVEAMAASTDITNPAAVADLLASVLARFSRVDILVNNAANNPKVGDDSLWSRFETYSLARWNQDLDVGITGAFLCSQIIGAELARRGRGVIVNVASDLGLIAPDQRLYRRDDLPEDQQPVKPVSYSVVKAAMFGLTRYLATYWADKGVRANALSPGGVFNHQDELFVRRFSSLSPLGRMARSDEYQGALLFLCSDASSYMTGGNLVVDGGRTCW
jgi:NAD(P)-dependent dehydrogenase (short-subunit alcohol dehydrogenase family)